MSNVEYVVQVASQQNVFARRSNGKLLPEAHSLDDVKLMTSLHSTTVHLGADCECLGLIPLLLHYNMITNCV